MFFNSYAISSDPNDLHWVSLDPPITNISPCQINTEQTCYLEHKFIPRYFDTSPIMADNLAS